ncbi:hypothetical protein ACLMJK_009473 [Lecanora helva]
MRPQMSSAVLLLFLFINISVALPSRVDFTRTVHASENLRSRYEESRKNPDSPPPSDLSISTRRDLSTGFQSFFDIGRGWNIYYSSWHASSLPIQPAAWALTNLYAAVLAQTQSSWKNGRPQTMLQAQIGQIQLLMLSNHAIPWTFVEAFATYMLSMTKGGWTGLYQAELSQAATDTFITVELRIQM